MRPGPAAHPSCCAGKAAYWGSVSPLETLGEGWRGERVCFEVSISRQRVWAVPGGRRDRARGAALLPRAGVNAMLRKVAVAAASKPHVEIRQDGDQFYIKTSTTVRTTEINFKVGEGFEEETVDGRKCRVRARRRAASRDPLSEPWTAAAGRAPVGLGSRWRAFPARPCTGGLQRPFTQAGCPGSGEGPPQSAPTAPKPPPPLSQLRLERREIPGGGVPRGCGCGCGARQPPRLLWQVERQRWLPPPPPAPDPRGCPGSSFSSPVGPHLSLPPSVCCLEGQAESSQSEADSGWGNGRRALLVLKSRSFLFVPILVPGMNQWMEASRCTSLFSVGKNRILLSRKKGRVMCILNADGKIVAAAVTYLKGDKMSPSLSPAFKTKKYS